jgi:hypothetical protein
VAQRRDRLQLAAAEAFEAKKQGYMSKYMAPPESPGQVKIKYQALDPLGRMEDRVVIQSLPEECSVQRLVDMCYDLVAASPRQPLELHYWGKVLEPCKLLREYAVKPHSELKLVLRPRLPVRAPCHAHNHAQLDSSHFIWPSVRLADFALPRQRASSCLPARAMPFCNPAFCCTEKYAVSHSS